MSRLTLTFDNGPTAGITERVLDTLDRFSLRTTFFLVGTQLQQPGSRALAQEARARGHWIGNHTMSHGLPLGKRTQPGESRDEILRMHEALSDLTGEQHLFRPNGYAIVGPHLLNQEAVDTLRELKSTVVLWSSVPKDRKVDVPTPDAWVAEAKRDALASDWSLMVLHDRPTGHDGVEAMTYLPEFLEWALDQGIEIVQEMPDQHVAMHSGVPCNALASIVAGAAPTS